MNKKYHELNFNLEVFLNCKAYCSGCNVNKNYADKFLFNNEELKLINNKIIDYYYYLSKKNKNTIYEPALTLGPADFLNNDVDKILELCENFDSKIHLNLAGNLSLEEESKKLKQIYEYGQKNNKSLSILIIFNPLLKDKDQKTLKQNIQTIKQYWKKEEIDVIVNMSKTIYTKLTPKDLLEILKDFEIDLRNITASPPDILLGKKEYNTPLKEETDWLVRLYKEWHENYKNQIEIDFLDIIKNKLELYFKSLGKDREKIIEYLHSYHKEIFFIDKHMNLRLSSEHIGDYHYIEESNFIALGNLKNNDIKDITDEVNFKKILNKQISHLFVDKLCKNCDFLLYCIGTPVYWHKQKFKQFKGEETEDYCYGFKQINQLILEDINKNE